MYQWRDPDTGTTHFSGNPPAWYRSGENGPRVLVFEKGKLIDDTSIRLSEEANNELRLRAIARAEEDREIARQKAIAAEELKTRMEKSESDELISLEEPAESLPAEPAPEELAQGDSTQDAEETTDPAELTTEEMRELILQWERQRTEQAKQEIYDSGN